MSTRFANIDRDTPMLMAPDMRDWIPADDMVHFILDAVGALELKLYRVNTRGTGSEQYPPSMLLPLLIYCYANGVFSSRRIERATYRDVAVRYICANTHPDHDTICKFRRENEALFSESFVKVLALAAELGQLKKVGGISVDGSKIQANASKHSAVSYDRSGKLIEQLELEVRQLITKAEDADSSPLEEGLSIPQEIVLREERKAKLEEARKVIEERFAKKLQREQADYDAKIQTRTETKQRGESAKGRNPKAPLECLPGKMQYNFTDPDSSIMKAGNGKHFEQCYNAQAAVDTEGSMLILGARVTTEPNDKKELEPTVKSVDPDIRKITHVAADNGFYSEAAVEKMETDGGPTVYAAVEKHKHGRSVGDLEKKNDPPEPPADASTTEKMRHRLRTKEGKAKYKLRKETVEPVFGIIKEVMGFRRFLLRGRDKVSLEWKLVSLAYNFKRLFRLAGAAAIREYGRFQASFS